MEINTSEVSGTDKANQERRAGKDRRKPGSFWSVFSANPRRRRSCGRRQADKGSYIDIYGRKTWGVAIAVLVLSILDAFLTRMHLVRGSAQELNPLMKSVIDVGGYRVFFAIKVAMTFFPMAVIMIHKEWKLGRCAARVCLFAYIFLTGYHLYLLLVTR